MYFNAYFLLTPVKTMHTKHKVKANLPQVPPYQHKHIKKLMKIGLLNQKVQALLIIYIIQGIIVTSFNFFYVCLT